MIVPAYDVDVLISAKAIAARIEGAGWLKIRRPSSRHRQAVVVGPWAWTVRVHRRPGARDRPAHRGRLLEALGDGDPLSPRQVRILKDLRARSRVTRRWSRTSSTPATRCKHVLEILGTRHPKRIEVCALLDKPSRREVPVKAKWVGFEIPDTFVVGYGIDYAQRNRNLPHIGSVRFTELTRGRGPKNPHCAPATRIRHAYRPVPRRRTFTPWAPVVALRGGCRVCR